jgi:transposase
MNEKRKRPNFTKEFKQDAVKLVVEQRYSCPEVGRRLGVAASNVSRWVRQYRQDQQDLSEQGVPRKELEAEIRRLKKENKRLEMERDILKNGLRSLYPPMITKTLTILGGRGRQLNGVFYPLKNVVQE